MRKFLLIAVLVTGCVLLFTHPAQSQGYYDTILDAPRWNLHGGVAFLQGDTGDNTTYIIGLEYQMPYGSNDRGRTGFITVEADVIPIDTLSTGTENVYPVMLGYKQYGGLGGYRVYTQLAAGVRWSTEEIPELRIKDSTEFEWAARLGVDFDQDIFAQAGFVAGSHPKDDGAITVELGIRF